MTGRARTSQNIDRICSAEYNFGTSALRNAVRTDAEHELEDATEAVGAESLDDEGTPALTTGQAAELLGVRQAFLRSLDAGRMVRPDRSAGGHRRWSRRQLALAARIRELFDEGLTLTAAAMVVTLQDEVALVTRERDQAHDELDRARDELSWVRGELAAARGGTTALPVPSAHPHRVRGPEVPTTALRPPLPIPPPQRTSST